MAENYYYFDGDPETESARRHMERVLNESPSRHRKWPWVLAAVAGAAAWYFWPRSPEKGGAGQSAAEDPASKA